MRLNLNNYKRVYRAKRCSIETMTLLGYELVDVIFVVY